MIELFISHGLYVLRDFEDIKLDNSDLRHFQVSYDPDTKERDGDSVNFGYELYLSNYEQGAGNTELAYSKLDSISKQIFLEVFNKFTLLSFSRFINLHLKK